jgi:phage-related minor tail protein
MAAATKNISIRIAVIDGDKVRRELTLTGETGQRALKRIEEATKPASRQLLAVNVVGEQVRYGMQNLAGGAGTLGTSLMRLGPAGLAAAAVLGTIGLAVAAGIKEFKEAEQALKQLNAALEATDHTSGVTARQITALGEAVEGNTLFKKEDIQGAAAALTSYQNVSGETFTRALRLSADLAVRLGTDIPSAAETLGRALESPENGLGRLARKFSDLSPAQKDTIDNFVKQGDVAAAQAVILEHLEGKTKGLAEAQAKGLTGASNELGDAWDDLLESLGRTVGESSAVEGGLNAITRALRGLQEALDPTREQQKSGLEADIARIQNSFGGKLDAWVFGEAPAVTVKKKELQKINDEIAAEQRKADEEQAKAQEAAARAAAERRNGQLLELQKKFLKESEDLTLTSQEKILKEADERRKQIEALNKTTGNAEEAQRAIAALEASTKAKLTEANKEAARAAEQLTQANDKVVESLQKRLAIENLSDPKSKFIQAEADKLNASATKEYREQVDRLAAALYDLQAAEKAAKEAEENRNKAIEEINRGILRTKPSYEDAKTALDEWKAKLINDLGGATEANQHYLDQLDQIYSVKLKDIYYRSLLDSDKWEDGVARAFHRYADEATNAAWNAERVFSDAASSIEDTLVDMVSTGEFSLEKLGDLIQSIEQDILRAFIRQNISGPIAGALGDMLGGGDSGSSGGGGIFGSFFSDIFSSIFHGGGVVGESLAGRRAMPAYLFAGAPRFHNGLMPDEFPAILQKGETVLPKNVKAGGMNVTFNISTPDAQSFMESQGQIMSRFAGSLQRYRTRNA